MIDLKSIQTEIDASFLYKLLAENEEDKNVANVFHQMSEIEQSHAVAFATKNGLDLANLPLPSRRAKTLKLIGKIFGYDYVLGVLLDTEKSISNAVVGAMNIPMKLSRYQRFKLIGYFRFKLSSCG